MQFAQPEYLYLLAAAPLLVLFFAARFPAQARSTPAAGRNRN